MKTPFKKWFLLFFFLAGVSLVGINMLWLIPVTQDARHSTSILLLTIADHVRDTISLSFDDAIKELTWTSQEIVHDPLRMEELLVLREKENSDFFVSLSLVNHTGAELIKVDRSGTTSPENLKTYSKDSFFYLALTGSPSFSPIFLSDNEPHIIMAVPVSVGGVIDRVLIAEVDLKKIADSLHNVSVANGRIYITDKDGYMIMSSDSPGIVHSSLSARPIVEKVQVDGQAVGGLSSDNSYINERGERMFAVGIPISINGWGVFVEQSAGEALKSEYLAVGLALVIFILGIVMLGVALWSFLRLKNLNQQLSGLLLEKDKNSRLLILKDVKLMEANEHLEGLDKVKSEFVSVAAHQLRTPLTSLRWSLDGLIKKEFGEVNDTQGGILRDCLQVTINAIELVNDLLNIARLEEGTFGFVLNKQDVLPIVMTAIETYKNEAEKKKIAIDFKQLGEIAPVMIDREKIKLVVDNIIANAIKYSRAGGFVKVTVGIEGSSVKIAVTDSGIGIPQDQIYRVFSKFFRARNAMHHETVGTGLGLYMCKSILEKHGGSVTIESEEDKGTTVSVLLPRSK